MNTKSNLFFFLLLVMFTCSCKGKTTEDFLKVESTLLVLSAQVNSRNIPCSSNAEIKAVSSHLAWCAATVVDNGKAIVVRAEKNEGVGAEHERTATVTVSAGKADAVQIEVKQASQDAVFNVVGNTELQFGWQDAQHMLMVQTNVPFTAESSEPEWCRVEYSQKQG